MSNARQILVIGGIALAVIGMCHGTWYAVFAEHQAFDRMGGSLTAAFTHAAQRQPAQLAASLEEYREAKYNHERQVDAHGHWIGLAMLLIVLGVAFDRVAATEWLRLILAIGLLTSAVLFPLSVLLQTMSHGPLARGLAIASSGLMIAALGGTALGLALGSAGEKA
jgi:hypothetical protein